MLNKPVILAVDDEPNILKLISVNFFMDGFEVFTAINGITALELLAKCKPDIMLIDIMMPGMDGIELVDTVRGRSNVPIIMLTARGDVTSVQRALACGADDYITKPFNLKLLTVRVKNKLKRIGELAAGNPS